MEYQTKDIESKWKKKWQDEKVYEVSTESDLPKYYVLDMFPYPSGEGLHVGHPLGYIASDIFARYKRMNGFNVLHPMGYDAFGLPAEQYAIQKGVHPAKSTAQNIDKYRSQLDNLGFSFDWSREVSTSDPSFYKWTQWIFIQLFEHYYDNDADAAAPITDLIQLFEKEGNQHVNANHSHDDLFTADEWNGMTAKEKDDILMSYRLAYKKVGYVNWCEALGTILANDEVKDGVSERGGHPVEQRAMMQWSLRITAYAERLLRDLEDVEWTDSLKAQQRNWIGRSEGAQVFFDIEGHSDQIEVFTTRPDTIFGATFMVLAPELELVEKLTTTDQREEIDNYLKYVKTRSERDRMADVKAVTGAFTGSYAINPFTDQKIPIWIAEYVLKDYGTGAIMAVPSDDERDQRFAQKFGIEIIDVVDKTEYPDATLHDKLGKMINSGFITGMDVPEAIKVMIQKIEERKIGSGKINYKLRDAIFGRQRYWGEPIPIIYDREGVAHALPLGELPLELPELEDFQPGKGGKSPLSRLTEWVELPNGYTRETDTMPGYAGSSWYFHRYMDAHNDDAFVSTRAMQYWRDVDLYVGGTEHAVGHLMYSRFWNKFLFDKGFSPVKEPFKKLVNQGMIQGVIEYVYLLKEKKDGNPHFLCSGLAKQRGLEGSSFSRIPVHVNFVQNYGTADSYLNIESIRKFIEWRPDYAHAIFECSKGFYQNGKFTPKSTDQDAHLMTHSEVGKMSKRYFNVINPDDVVHTYGADCFRMYEMFLGPVEQSKPWDTNGIDGVSKFLRRLWSLFYDENGNWLVVDEVPSAEENKILHTCIKRVREDIDRFSFNTCVSQFMVCTNELKKIKCNKKSILTELILLLAPFAPFTTDELWEKLGHVKSIHLSEMPHFDESYLKEDSVEYPVCVNGKKRATLGIGAEASKEEMESAALKLDGIQKWIDGKEVRKVIIVPGRMINIVV